MQERSPHILSASANLLGFCFLVLTSLRALHLSNASYVDEITACVMIAFTASTLFSFLSMHRKGGKEWFETVADVCFL